MESPREDIAPPTVKASLPDDDARLVEAILRKDRKATAEFVEKYADPIYLYVRSRLVPRMDLVEDLVQEVFLAAWESLESYRGDAPLGAWLQGIARHKVENHYRTCLRAAVPLEEAEGGAAEVVMDIDLGALLDRERLQEKMHKILATLPEPYSLALLWRYWEHCSAREMAARTGKSEKAMERLLARAREMFREKWNSMERL